MPKTKTSHPSSALKPCHNDSPAGIPPGSAATLQPDAPPGHQPPPALANEPGILACFIKDLGRLGFVGEWAAAKLIFLAVLSRLLEQPVSIAVKGPSSAGKSYLVKQVLRFFPPAAYYALTAASERALIYSKESFEHRVLIFYEEAGIQGPMATYLVRSLLSEQRIDYETVDRTTKGLKPKKIVKKGPTGLILTTTKLRLHPENETRLLSITMTDSHQQTAAVLRALAVQVMDGAPNIDLAKWHDLQSWLKAGECRVVVPFAQVLSDLVPPLDVRLRRDFKAVLCLVQTHALLHRGSRDHGPDGQIVAKVKDYGAVRDLVHDRIAEGIEAVVPATIRETVQAVAELTDAEAKKTTTVAALAKSLGLDKSTTLRRVRAASRHGFLTNEETRRGRPARLAVGEPMPKNRDVLPTVEELTAAIRGCRVACESGGIERRKRPCVAARARAGRRLS
jgi:hypothetical protein